MIGSSMRMRSKLSTHTQASVQKIKVPDYRWVEEEAAFENSIRNKDLWIDSMFIQALIWTFGSIMTVETKADFDKWLKK